MQVKVCPKCKAENKTGNAACSSCYTSLENVPVQESTTPPPARTQAVPAAPKPPSAPARTQQMPSSQQTQMGTMSPPPPPPGQFQMMPPAKRSSTGPIIAIVIVLVLAVFGGAFYLAASKSGLLASAAPSEAPEKSVLKFLEAKKTHDFAKVEPYLCRNSVDMINNAYSGRQMQSAGFGKKDAESMFVFGVPPTADDMKGSEIVASRVKGDEYADSRTAVVRVVVDKKEAPPAPQQLLPPGAAAPPQAEEKHFDFSSFLGPVEVEYVLVAEGGQWKIDLSQSAKRELGLGKARLPFRMGK